MAGAPPRTQRDKPEHLTLVGSYRRQMPVSLERMYENALDWEHLPSLHRSTFSRIECLEAGDWGWRARVSMPSGDEMRMELLLDESQGRWISRVLEGATAGGEIWTHATELAAHEIVVEVDFYVPGIADQDLANMLGQTMVQLYTQLYDEDEGMMIERETALQTTRKWWRRSGTTLDPARLDQLGARRPLPKEDDGRPMRVRHLGPLDQLRARLPLTVQLDGLPYRIIQLGDELIAHSTLCPHWLGPLADAPIVDGCVECPWHGYRFDVRTGACTNHDGYRLPPAPRVFVTPDASHVAVALA